MEGDNMACVHCLHLNLLVVHSGEHSYCYIRITIFWLVGSCVL